MILDDVMVGQRADEWNNLISVYGDPIRMVLINKLVASLIDHFGRLDGRRRLAEPHKLIQQFIASITLSTDVQVEDLIPQFVAEHEDLSTLELQFPFLSGTILLDLGSGNGYLGGWLGSLGVQYISVEPSPDLNRMARDNSRLTKAKLIEQTVRDFCEVDCYPYKEPPTVISIIGVIDHLDEPLISLRALFNFLEKRNWLNVPILVTTFDPDFFLPGLPVKSLVLQTSAPYGVTEPRKIRDPASWEEMFVTGGFHVLEQRPLHISGLPKSFSMHLHKLFDKQFQRDVAYLRNAGSGDDQWVKSRVSPRQGPFYFWLLCPRKVSIKRRTVVNVDRAPPEPSQVDFFAEGETLSVVGNIAPRIYRVLKGGAYYDSPEIGRMEFHVDALFGQLEASCNYVSSRVLDTLKASPQSQLETIESEQILRYLVASNRFTDMLFLSLLRHLESVQFKRFVSAKRVDNRNSAVLPGKNYNCATFAMSLPSYYRQVLMQLQIFSQTTIARG